MAVLSDADRQKIWRGIMRHWSRLRESVPNMSKQDIRDAIDATDDWIETNQSSYNNALPISFRTSATPEQKTLLFCAVALMRVSGAFLRTIFGSID